MGCITFKGTPFRTIGNLPEPGEVAPAFTLTKTDLSRVSLADYAGKKVVLNIFPSIDTDVCAASVRRFNESATSRNDVVVLCISADLPFAHGRFCAAEGIENVVLASTFRSQPFAAAYGVTIIEGPLRELLSRAVLVINEKGVVVYAEQVPEIAQEPDYDAALAAL